MANSYVAFGGEAQAQSHASAKGKVILSLFVGFGLGFAAFSIGAGEQQVSQEQPVTAAALMKPNMPRTGYQPQLRSSLATPAWRMVRPVGPQSQSLRNVRVFDGDTATKELSPKVADIMEQIKGLTMMQGLELVEELEETFGVDASAGGGMMMMAPGAMPAGGGGGAAPAAEEKTTFDVVLDSVDESKRVAALKVVRGITGLGLKEVKDFMSALPKAVKEGASKEESEDIMKQLTEAGGKATIK
jgi:large subunit ribosomal protein L7/L12